jgi:hypothetical protein
MMIVRPPWWFARRWNEPNRSFGDGTTKSRILWTLDSNYLRLVPVNGAFQRRRHQGREEASHFWRNQMAYSIDAMVQMTRKTENSPVNGRISSNQNVTRLTMTFRFPLYCCYYTVLRISGNVDIDAPSSSIGPCER